MSTYRCPACGSADFTVTDTGTCALVACSFCGRQVGELPVSTIRPRCCKDPRHVAMAAHDGLAPHSHEVRADHLGVAHA